uniref:DCD domain-containing protein n=1 Tax=Arundo donax TaxID=35708 RepID=A0A0A9D0V7_ARUDO
MLLFLFERAERKLYGVFEATSDGALNILPDEFASLWKFRPAQVSMLYAFAFGFFLLVLLLYWIMFFGRFSYSFLHVIFL